MARRIRAKEAEVAIIVNGARQGDSMRKIRNLDITIDAEITKTNFVGEKRANNDLDVRGVDFTFGVHCLKRDWYDLWQDIQDAEEQGTEFPEIALLINFNYRGNPSHAIVISDDLILKLDSFNLPDADYVEASWSGAAQQIQGL